MKCNRVHRSDRHIDLIAGTSLSRVLPITQRLSVAKTYKIGRQLDNEIFANPRTYRHTNNKAISNRTHTQRVIVTYLQKTRVLSQTRTFFADVVPLLRCSTILALTWSWLLPPPWLVRRRFGSFLDHHRVTRIGVGDAKLRHSRADHVATSGDDGGGARWPKAHFSNGRQTLDNDGFKVPTSATSPPETPPVGERHDWGTTEGLARGGGLENHENHASSKHTACDATKRIGPGSLQRSERNR